jgi:hypothetical protein
MLLPLCVLLPLDAFAHRRLLHGRRPTGTGLATRSYTNNDETDVSS